MTTERTATQTLEDVLNGQPSDEENEANKVTEGAVKDEVATEESKAEEPKAESPKITFTPEQETEIGKRVQSESDKRSQSYQEKREADITLIRGLTDQIKELKKENRTRQGSRRIEAILAGDEEEGLEEDKIKGRGVALKDFQAEYGEYKEKSAEVEEAAQLIGKMTENLPKNIVREFGLDDANINIRAVNGVKFLDEAIAVYKHNLDFLMAIEHFMPKGDELRKQLNEIVEGMAEFESDKSKTLYLKDRLRGVKIAPRKSPSAPSDGSGGLVLSGTIEERMERALERAERRK